MKRMSFRASSMLVMALAIGVLSPVAGADPAEMPQAVQAVLETHCTSCHAGEEATAGIDLASAQTQEDIFTEGRTWNKVLRVVRSHEMPPKSEAVMSDEDRQLLFEWIEASFRNHDCLGQTEPGHVTVRRLNRVEYRNTIRDLFGMDLDAARDLPADAAGNGFDNQGDTLFIPPVLMEKYLDTTKRLLEQAMAEGAPARAMLLAVTPSESVSPAEVARQNLRAFLPRAFRRPVKDDELAARVALVEQALGRGESFEQGLQTALLATLLSPHFLFRIEQDQAPEGSNEAYPITDHELATRLSYFLWSTMPDGELTELADAGRLSQPEVLREQVARMLADPKSIALAEEFTSQWFGYRDLRTHEMDIRRFGGFNGVRDAMYEESRMFFDTLFRENGRVLDIVDCNYAFVNDRLAEHYGLPKVEGGQLRKVELADRRRGGVLGMGSTLTVSSYPTRTSPVLRGKWVLETILGTPPPPPPPNVKEISKSDEVKDGLTLRQRFERHRAQESCASCHAKMDPLGFALENFDGIGKWRDQDNGIDIDAAAALPDGRELNGIADLKDALLARQELFLRQLVERTLTYALGRAVDFYDECTIRQAISRLAEGDHRSHELILSVVESYPFRHKKNAP
ncbi:MAG: DUF1592 domain-containing protein [Pirellulales bacterium]|nr:DUF1592 domain-containing protein [Pirellulales bacterium]